MVGLWGGRRVSGAFTRNLTPEAGAFRRLLFSRRYRPFRNYIKILAQVTGGRWQN
ncbi:hypothetical protein D1BOALGB6SA_8222 [Olavius sp. associated proteobacterium Delta 1]|nr:hypothetical protein D1BOALGB6SA_8222 [Olavius sp. associated proteobacterium Delta 1]